jgi:hypothetical protein
VDRVGSGGDLLDTPDHDERARGHFRSLDRGARLAFAVFSARGLCTIASAMRRSRSNSRSSSSTLGRYVRYFAAKSCLCSFRIE